MNSTKALIIAKTYPELSSKYGETVCTAAVDEQGRPVRLYPIPFRYLEGPHRFQRYQWISAALKKSSRDTRPESFSIETTSIVLQSVVKPTPDEWGLRAEAVLKWPDWQYSSMQRLTLDQQTNGRSIAFVRPARIKQVTVHRRPNEDAESFEQKLNRLKAENAARRNQLSLFEETIPPEMKSLKFIGERVCVEWYCLDDHCHGHSMQVLDWEICELGRREGLEKARQKVEDLLDLNRYKAGFILGNFHMFPSSFAIIGLWYPKLNPLLF